MIRPTPGLAVLAAAATCFGAAFAGGTLTRERDAVKAEGDGHPVAARPLNLLGAADRLPALRMPAAAPRRATHAVPPRRPAGSGSVVVAAAAVTVARAAAPAAPHRRPAVVRHVTRQARAPEATPAPAPIQAPAPVQAPAPAPVRAPAPDPTPAPKPVAAPSPPPANHESAAKPAAQPPATFFSDGG